MKASVLITELTKLVDQYGDLKIDIGLADVEADVVYSENAAAIVLVKDPETDESYFQIVDDFVLECYQDGSFDDERSEEEEVI